MKQKPEAKGGAVSSMKQKPEAKDGTVSSMKQKPEAKDSAACSMKQELEAKDTAACCQKQEPPQPAPPPQGAPCRREEGTGKEENSQEKPSVFVRIAAAIRRFCEGLKNLLADSAHAAAALGEKAERLGQTWDYYQRLFHSAGTRKVMDKFLGHGKKLFRHILPRKLTASLTLGTGDPASTANLLALHGMFYPLVGETVHITPDFHRACLAGTFSAKGRVRLCVPIYHLLAVILDKKTWRLIRQLKKEEVANGR